MLASTEEKPAKQKSNNEPDRLELSEIKEKLQCYLLSHSSAKDKWLLACHAHCFIPLS